MRTNMNNTIRMNKKHIYTAPEVEVVMIRFDQSILSVSVTSSTPAMQSGTFGDGSGDWD